METVYANSGLLGVLVLAAVSMGVRWFDRQSIRQMQHASMEDQKEASFMDAYIKATERRESNDAIERQRIQDLSQRQAVTLSTELIGLKELFEKEFRTLGDQIRVGFDRIIDELNKGDNK